MAVTGVLPAEEGLTPRPHLQNPVAYETRRRTAHSRCAHSGRDSRRNDRQGQRPYLSGRRSRNPLPRAAGHCYSRLLLFQPRVPPGFSKIVLHTIVQFPDRRHCLDHRIRGAQKTNTAERWDRLPWTTQEFRRADCESCGIPPC